MRGGRRGPGRAVLTCCGARTIRSAGPPSPGTRCRSCTGRRTPRAPGSAVGGRGRRRQSFWRLSGPLPRCGATNPFALLAAAISVGRLASCRGISAGFPGRGAEAALLKKMLLAALLTHIAACRDPGEAGRAQSLSVPIALTGGHRQASSSCCPHILPDCFLHRALSRQHRTWALCTAKHG